MPAADATDAGATKPRAPAPKIGLAPVNERNVGSLKTLNSVVFPVSYSNRFYTDVLRDDSLSRLAYITDILVGAVACRVDKRDDADASGSGGSTLYIKTLGVLAPYRELGVGQRLLDFVLDDVCATRKAIDRIELHVQVNNDAAIRFYKRNGFEVADTIRGYYKRIEPSDCHVLVRRVEPASKRSKSDDNDKNNSDAASAKQ